MGKPVFAGMTSPSEGAWTIARARLMLRDRVAIGGAEIAGNRIVRLWDGDERPSGAIDFDGDFLLPGLIELHTDNLEKHLLPRAGVSWPALPAMLAHDAQLLAAGITTVLDAMALGDLEEDGGRIDTLRNALAALDDAREHHLLRCDHYLHLRCELSWPGLLALAEPLVARGDLRLLSLMDHTPGQRQYHDVRQYRTYYSRSGITWSDEEFVAVLEERREQQLQHRDLQLAGVLELARRHGVLVASHDDTDVAHVDEAVAVGARICEFPTTLAAAHAARERGLSIVAGASNLVRGGSHAGNVAAIALARTGCLDILSSDYMPTSLLQGAFILHEQAGWTLPEAIASVTATPAAVLGFADRGQLAEGWRADLLRVRMHRTQPVVRAAWVAGVQRL
ncbi:alpha-D-ribose 1-methylphosphonate 5-triphosphate diphosphatase [Dyella sp. ASV21]|jgi:alpha-D-ribose 1-methylphosphonate 5-triphosphate diphosphatase|uniref:alpha-D-ribose 1-methylphosphonate 5-triphosphate diphosphatase n=1 Tax=Dyella sp. ASV21 TaxID=2795114 RepID=UPI001E56FFD7|nr:alpha-D-ribose 1-methylphosphonate 5-triphosphate diphosphatase [Dyella sp. ASV21]